MQASRLLARPNPAIPSSHPSEFRSRPTRAQADIYSAALVVHYLVTGLLPSADVRRDPAARPAAAAAAARDPAAAALAEAMWAADPEARPAAAACVARLDAAPPPPPSPPGRCAPS